MTRTDTQAECDSFGSFSPALLELGFCMFVLSLVKKHYRLQFYMVREATRAGVLALKVVLPKLNRALVLFVIN